MLDLYRWMWRLTKRVQFSMIALSVMVAALAALHLQYQKDIVNALAERLDWHAVLFLGAQFFGVLILSGALKFALGYRSSLLGESVVREVRNQIFRTQRRQAAPKEDRSVHRGSLVTMISSEAEQVGSFAGQAIATPLMQIGVLISVIAFMAATQPLLGAFVMALVLFQAVIVLGVQKRINLRVAERVRVLRRTSDRMVVDEVDGAQEGVLADFDEIFEAQRRIFLLKQSSKFALNFMNALGVAGILMLGGWLVLEGRTDVGTVVADVTGLARIAQPWRELISFFRSLSGVRVRYELLKGTLPG